MLETIELIKEIIIVLGILAVWFVGIGSFLFMIASLFTLNIVGALLGFIIGTFCFGIIARE